MQNILFISHRERQCGVYQYGKNISGALIHSTKYNFIYAECSSAREYVARVRDTRPQAVIYNYYPSTLPWLTRRLMGKFRIPHIGIMHEVTQQTADAADGSFFNYHIAPDPTLLLKNPIVFKTGRLIPRYTNTFPYPETPVIGSFGFGTNGKGFDRLITTVQREFDSAVIRLHIPFATFGDADGSEARSIAQQCKELIVKPGIKLVLSHEFLDQGQLLDFLAQNSLNAFFYEENRGRGISSVIDHALAVQRPIAITRSTMFRHITATYPSICTEETTLTEIMKSGTTRLQRYCREWSEENLIWDYERLVDQVLQSTRRKSLSAHIMNRLKLAFSRSEPKPFRENWMPGISDTSQHHSRVKRVGFPLKDIGNVLLFNRILDQSARDLYQPVIDDLFKLLPDMMAHKIPEANVQQAFVLDTVRRFAARNARPRMLCIGSYDDTAAEALNVLGYDMDEVDPVLNYDLNAFYDRPSTVKEGYDIIFSTSVLEHVNDDDLFMKQMAGLLAPGGTAVLTVDFDDHYQPGNCIPREDFRLYTQRDFKERLLPLLKGCSLVDEPKWDCPNPDFKYAGCQYTFASLVFQKAKA